MNFQGLNKIETPDYYLDIAIKRTKKVVDEKRGQKLRGSPIQKSKTIEITKLESVEKELRELLQRIPVSYPSIDSLPEFYRELISVTLEIPLLKQSLGSIKWCVEKNRTFMQKYVVAIKRSTEIERINQYRREFYGRVSSTLKQIKPNLAYLEESRKIMMNYPSVKTGLPTVAIAGFPNVGKSTLLSKITPAKPKIASYAFTTQGINLGYSEIKGQKVQFMDTPGTLSRFEKQNLIERIATLALKYVADVVVYVFDPTESYPMEKQVELLETIKKTKRQIIIYISKTDIADKKIVNELKKKYKASTSYEEVVKELEKIDLV